MKLEIDEDYYRHERHKEERHGHRHEHKHHHHHHHKKKSFSVGDAWRQTVGFFKGFGHGVVVVFRYLWLGLLQIGQGVVDILKFFYRMVKGTLSLLWSLVIFLKNCIVGLPRFVVRLVRSLGNLFTNFSTEGIRRSLCAFGTKCRNAFTPASIKSFLRKFTIQNIYRNIKEGNAILGFEIYKVAYVVGLLMIAVVVWHLYVTLALPIFHRTDMLAVYSRNGSAILCFALFGVFLILWCYKIVGIDDTKKGLIKMRIATLSCAVISLVKSLLSVWFTVVQSVRGLTVFFYYSSDIFAWFMVALFMVIYFMKELTNKKIGGMTFFDKEHFSRFTFVILLLAAAKTLIAAVYVSVRFNLYGIAWTYFLSDTLGWLLITLFLFSYHENGIMDDNDEEDNFRKLDWKTAKAMERVGRH